MKRYNTLTITLLTGLLGLAVTSFAVMSITACAEQDQVSAEIDSDESTPWISGIGSAYPLVEGLHVTGTPVDIDLQTYRLEVTGAVDTPLSLSLAEIQAMEAQREFVTLVCPGFFVDEGHWTGIRIADLLDLAGVKEEATQINFVAADGNYSATLRLPEVQGEGMLIAWAFEDKPLPKVHGFPLRVVAKDQQGNRWVKWLGEIVVK
jgi:DMSO/TMAO reductase YedYZ molybdopterin-dependent catalytic subunit